MNKQKLFNKLWDTFKFTEIDFEEIVIGDEEETEVYFKFKNVKGGDWLFILTWIGKLLYGDKYDELMKKTNKTRRRR